MDVIKLCSSDRLLCLELTLWNFIQMRHAILFQVHSVKLMQVIKIKAKINVGPGLVSEKFYVILPLAPVIWFVMRQDKQKLVLVSQVSLRTLVLRLNPKQKTSIQFGFSLSIVVALWMRNASHKQYGSLKSRTQLVYCLGRFRRSSQAKEVSLSRGADFEQRSLGKPSSLSALH